MTRLSITLVLLLCACSLALSSAPIRGIFDSWAASYGKTYSSVTEREHRFQVFEKNYYRVQTYNTERTFGNATFTINQFSDLTPQEFKSQYASCHVGRKQNPDVNPAILSTRVTLPASVDWRNQGAVTPVKNQGQCGSCWSFGTTGTMEGAHFIATGNLVSLSEQNLIDCSTAQYNQGCNGGRADWAIEYIIANKGIDTEASYPYTGEDGTCNYNPANSGATATGWQQTATGDETALQIAVATIGPIAVAISVDDAWANYQSGVYTDSTCPNDADDLDHEVLVVGYGTLSGQAYWIVKNSWGASWGANGYILMARNNNNMCGIATDAVYPTGVQ